MQANSVLNGRYRLDSKIGEGGFGAVYRGVELATNKKVALKLLHPQMAKDQNLIARFRREGMVSCNLHDPHTITTYEFDQTPDGTLYIAMELLEGKSLTNVYKEQKPLDWRRMFKIVLEMCSSLGEAHAQGIVHRDLKPDNVYLEVRPGNPEFVKVLDFGMAKVVRGDVGGDPNAAKLTAMGQTLGTLEYMSPEQLMGAAALDARSDIYALGVLAYEMMTGQLPFPGINQPVALMMAQMKEAPKPPSTVNPSIPPEADAIIMKCLEKMKTDRYETVGQLSAAIQHLIIPQQYAQPAPPPMQQMAPPMQPPPMQMQQPPHSIPLPPNPPAPHVPPVAMHTASPAATSGGGNKMIFIIIGVVVLGGAIAAIMATR